MTPRVTLRIAVACIVDPHGNNDGGRRRTQTILRALNDLGHEVTCYVTGPPEGLLHPGVRYFGSGNLGSRGLLRHLGPTKRRLLPVATSTGAICPEMSAAMQLDGPFDVFLATDLPCWRFAADSGARVTWLDFSDVTSEVARRYSSVVKGLPRWTATRQARWVRRQETKAAGNATVVTTAGASDANVVAAFAPHVQWIPTPVDVHRMPPRESDDLDRPVAGFLANFDFAPNRDAFELLSSSWAPRLTRLGWRVVAAGYGSDQLSPADNVDILGEIDHLDDYYSLISCALVPLRLGGGIKVKAIEALVVGLPVLCTQHVADGFPMELREFLTIVDAECPDMASALAALRSPVDAQTERFSYGVFRESVRTSLAVR